MTRAIVVFRAVTGILFLIQLVLGIVFWTGHALPLTQLHMGLGVMFVLALWALAILCGRAGAGAPLVVITLVWGLLLAWLGMAQVQLVPGPQHWVIRVVHLLVGIVAMAFAGRVTVSVRAGAVRGPA